MDSVASLGPAALLVASILLVALWFYKPKRALHLPPAGPKLTSRSKVWLRWDEAAKAGQPIISYQQGKKITIVLNTAEYAYELLEKRSAIYSSRPAMVLANVARRGASGLIAPYGNMWRKWRKLVHSALNGNVVNHYKPWQQVEATLLMKELMTKPSEWREFFGDFSANVVMQISYGFRPRGRDDPALEMNHKAAMGQLPRFAANSIVEEYPILQYTPRFLESWLPDLKEARVAYDNEVSGWIDLFNDVKVRMDQGRAAWSLARDIHSRSPAEHGLTHAQLALTAAVPYGAGVDTTRALLVAFATAVAASGPTFLPRARAEIDSVVGPERMPTFDDLPNLPFINAIGKEIHRWAREGPMGIPHAPIQDDTFAGYDIPKGATVIANLWSIHWDEKYFPEPEKFKPERFLEEKVPFPGPAGHFGFGLGRRICPGQHLAENAYLIAIARMIWAFDMGASKKINLEQDNWSDMGVITLPIDIPVTFKPRSEKHARIIEEEAAAAMLELKQTEVH